MTHTRHEWIDDLCTRLERVIIGQAAEDLLADEIPARAALVRAPVWRWLAPRIDMGRKTLRSDGATMLMPVRMTWQRSPLTLVTEPVELAWSMVGLGHSGAGTVHVIPTTGAAPVPTGDRFPTGGVVDAPVMAGPELRAELARLADDGHQARWEILMSFEHYVERAVHSAVVSVSYDIAGTGTVDGSEPDWVLDATGKQTVTDRMLLGQGDSPGQVSRLVDRCLAPGAFVKVDPLRYVVTDLHRSAEQEVRRAIGDPRIGRKIRAVRRAMPSATLEELIAAYRERHPNDQLSTRRALAALTAGPDVMAVFTDLCEADAAVEPVEDIVLTGRIDRTGDPH